MKKIVHRKNMYIPSDAQNICQGIGQISVIVAKFRFLWLKKRIFAPELKIITYKKTISLWQAK